MRGYGGAGGGVVNELRRKIRGLLDEDGGDWSRVLPHLRVWMRVRMQTADGREALTREAGPRVGAKLRSFVQSALDEVHDPDEAMRLVRERMNSAENPVLAEELRHERWCVFAGAVWRVFKQEADAWNQRRGSGAPSP